ncbi:MAG: hypothetical protein AAFX02_00910 [Pseudomonadota bacterium]
MARLERYSGTQNLPNVRRPGVVADTAVGQATAALGGQIQRSGAQAGQLVELAQRRQQQIDTFEGKRAFLKFEGDMAQRETKALQHLQPGAADYTKDLVKQYREDSAAFIEKLPPSIRSQGKLLVQDGENRLRNRASKTELTERSRYFQEGIAEGTNELAKRISADPSAANEWRAEGHELIASSLGTPIEKETAHKAWDRLASLAVFDKLPASVRAAMLPQSGDGDYFAAIRSAESGGNDNAKNPNSSATGRYQFTSGTWNQLRKNHPELGLTADGRTDPIQQEKAIRAFTADNAAVLQSNGIETTNANLYAAHFLGAGGAVQVLTAADETKISSIVSPGVIKANQFLRSMTVGDFRSWTAQKAGGGVTVKIPDKYKELMSHLTYADTLRLTDQAQTDLASIATDIFKGFRQRIVQEPEQPGLRDEIRYDDFLDPGQKASLEKELNTELNRNSAKREAIAFGNSATQGNPYDSTDRKKADDWYQIQQEHGVSPDEAAEANLAKGVPPKSYLTDILNGAGSRNPEEVLLAHQRAAAALTLYPEALRGTASAEDVAEAGRRWHFQTEEAGLSPQEASAKIAALNNPERREANEALRESKEVKDALKKIDAAFIERQVAHWISGVPIAGAPLGALGNATGVAQSPSLGWTPQQKSEGVLDFQELFVGGMVREGGDQKAALNWATDRFQKLWQTSEFFRGGDNVLTKYPAELLNRPVNGSWEYLHAQAVEALSEEGIDDYQEYWFEHVVEPSSGRNVTLTEMRAGRIPAMVLNYRDMAGKEQFVPVAFRGDPDQAQSEYLADLAIEQDRESSVKAARVNFKERQRAYQAALSDYDNPNREEAVLTAYEQLEAARSVFGQTVERVRSERREEQLEEWTREYPQPRTPPLESVRQQVDRIRQEKGN